MPWIFPTARKKPSTLGVFAGRLGSCPSTPNCVSSQATIEAQRVDPLSYHGDPMRARLELINLLQKDSKATIVTETEDYLHVEFRALVFIDDVEFYFPQGESVIHIRSASRVGHSDLGANKRRVQAISAAFSSRQ